MKPIIAVTMGDPAGIGPEICLRMAADATVAAECVPAIYGDTGVLRRVAARLGLPMPARVFGRGPAGVAGMAGTPGADAPCVVDCDAVPADAVTPGRIDAASGGASFAYIEAAIADALAGRVAAVATAPVHKEALHAAGVPFPGHTEIFAAKTDARRACMMLTSDELTCGFVTTHVGYHEVPGLLSRERIRDVIELTADAVSRLRGRPPRLVVCGLNPHAGENGLFGQREEERFILPAVADARALGLTVEGPLPPDTAFLPKRRASTDAFVCMYHDQGHIPLKMLAFDTAINCTLGLPVIRTSVDHGTALDIAWTGKANHESLCNSVRLAAKLASTPGWTHAARGAAEPAGATA